MGRVYTGAKEASDFLNEYHWWIVGIMSLMVVMLLIFYV